MGFKTHFSSLLKNCRTQWIKFLFLSHPGKTERGQTPASWTAYRSLSYGFNLSVRNKFQLYGLVDITFPNYLFKRKKKKKAWKITTVDLKLVWRGKNAKFDVQSDGSKNIFSVIICSRGTDITLNYNNIAYLSLYQYLHEHPVSYTKVIAKVVMPSHFGCHIKST